jgi:alpha-methylacyl-CoA racemase
MPPLVGTKVVEIAGLAPAPFAGMFLADFGADVIRVDRVGVFNPDNLARGKRSIALDLRSEQGKQVFLKLIGAADVLIEPFRPGVMERLGLGPDVLMKLNPRLVYARMTGFGQDGRYAKMAGHDINYIAASGVLSAMGRAEPDKPYFPLNILGDFAGGGFMCAVGCLLSLLERQLSGQGQVVDVAMVDGAAYLATFIYKAKALGDKSPVWPRPRGENMLDGGAHFYEIYRTRDGKYMSVYVL